MHAARVIAWMHASKPVTINNLEHVSWVIKHTSWVIEHMSWVIEHMSWVIEHVSFNKVHEKNRHSLVIQCMLTSMKLEMSCTVNNASNKIKIIQSLQVASYIS